MRTIIGEGVASEVDISDDIWCPACELQQSAAINAGAAAKTVRPQPRGSYGCRQCNSTFHYRVWRPQTRDRPTVHLEPRQKGYQAHFIMDTDASEEAQGRSAAIEQGVGGTDTDSPQHSAAAAASSSDPAVAVAGGVGRTDTDLPPRHGGDLDLVTSIGSEWRHIQRALKKMINHRKGYLERQGHRIRVSEKGQHPLYDTPWRLPTHWNPTGDVNMPVPPLSLPLGSRRGDSGSGSSSTVR